MTVSPFVYRGTPARIIFGSGTLKRLPAEVEPLGLARVLVLSTPQQADQAAVVAGLIGARAVATFSGARMHTPVEVTMAALEVVTAERIDGVVAIGGGSTIGLGKAIALRTDLPQIVVPTTYAGSEVTAIIGETADGEKRTQTSPRVLPEVVIYDVDLTLGLPAGLSATSGLNAMAHAVEALYAPDCNPITSLMAIEAVAKLAHALPRIATRPDDPDARSDALYGAWLCGTCLGAVGMALHHKLCHTLGGAFGLPHAETHAVLLPHALAYNAPAVPEVIARLGGALGGDPASALFALGARIGAPTTLAALGMPAEAIERAADLALANPYWNPRPLDRPGIRSLLARAWAGEPPRA